MKNLLKITGIILGCLLGLLLVLSGILYGIGRWRLNRVYQVSLETVDIPEDQASLKEGKRIFQYRGCEACHGEQLEGLVYLDNPALGRVITPNLTDGQEGIGAQRTTEDLIRAIRHGLGPDSTPLLFMPSTEFYYLSDRDLGQVLAYLRSKPPIANQTDPSELSPTGFMVMNLTREITFLPAELIPHNQPRPSAPKAANTPEYGQYLSYSCFVCHGPTLSGGEIAGFPPEWPAAPNLTTGKGSRLPAWGAEGFIEILQNGEKHGRTLHPDYMPWTSYRHLTPEELEAVFTFLISLPEKEYGGH